MGRDSEAGLSFGILGGAERDRTADLLVANEALSQLSYSPPPDVHETWPIPAPLQSDRTIQTCSRNDLYECNRRQAHRLIQLGHGDGNVFARPNQTGKLGNRG